jgi:pimeloyl-ACP methyl ester carboxylesterase
MREAGRQGTAGHVDDRLFAIRDWGFALEQVTAPTQVMRARDNTTNPPAHGSWLVDHLPNAELILVDGDHWVGRHAEKSPR